MIDLDLQQILTDAKTIAVVGCSGRPTRPSYGVSRYLISAGYTIIPINPNYEEVHGIPCLPDLGSIQAGTRVDIVNVFRNPRHAADVVRDTIALADRIGSKPVIWMQLGVSSQEAVALAEEAGLPYVGNRCIRVEHSRYF
ncbi:MAG TPA: CoA-binding protein [Rhodothermales bacterium]